ncbi:oligosaccharide flippase family protein [Jejudonia soesokkakensis]|uniref:Oligosaccharide flippase family protein n=1 Tax=Jejudonia soesokkakensis TaxID=1323432 RepID=A0ABW2MQL5_9FLAO
MINLKTILENSVAETFLKSTIFMVLRVLSFILAYVFAFLTIRYFDESVYGFVTMSFTVMIIVSVFCVMGFDIALTKLFAEENSIERHGSKFYSALLVSLTISLMACSSIYVFSDFISLHFFKKPNFSPYLQWTALTIPFWSLLLIISGTYRGLKNIWFYSIFNSFGRFLLALLLLLLLAGVVSENIVANTTPVIGHFIGIVLLFSIAFILAFFKIKPRKIKINRTFKEFFSFSTSIFISASLIILLTWSDKLILGIFVEEELVGIYDIAIRISALIIFSLDAINSILTPKLSTAFYKNELVKMQSEINTISKVNILVSLFVFVLIIIFNPFIFKMFSEDFLLGQTALYIVCIAQLINSFTGPVWNIMQMTGQQKALSKILIITLIVNIFLNIVLIKEYGIEGAAIATGISIILWNITATVYIYKKLGIRTYYFPKRFSKAYD